MRFAGERTALVLLALGCGCGEEPITEVFACYAVDPSFRTSGGAVELSVVSSDGSQILYQSEIGDLTLTPVSHGYVQQRFEGVLLSLTGRIPDPTGGPEQVVTQRARVPFQSERVVDVSLWIEMDCLRVGCGVEETCVGGACRPVDVDPSCLADHLQPAPAGCDDPRVARGCEGP